MNDVNNLGAVQRGNRTRLMQNMADMLQDRLSRHGERHGRNIGMPQRQDARAKMKMAIVVRACEAQLRQRVETSPYRCPRKSRLAADLRVERNERS